ncbi:MAG TPA: penicillin-binding transpeptidase domain-containing protein, partial [Solirubrobacteraceae bacterium]
MSAIEPGGGGWPGEDRSRMPVSPQLALRVAILGGLAMAMFAIIFFRLWFLQVLSGEQYVQQANANRARDLPIAAPRGEILDREGQPLVASRTTNAVQIVPSALPPAGRERVALYRRLGRLLGMSGAHVQELVIKGRTAVPYAPVTIKTDAGRGALTVLAERQSEFPGVTQQPVSIRAYPYGAMAAQVLGYVGQVSEGELKLRAFHGVKQGTVVGQEGLEYYYDRYLRGEPGIERVEVNAQGYPVPSNLAPTQPKAGYSLKVTLDRGLQREGEKALVEGIENARAGGKPAVAGAFVALDPRNGQVLAMGSSPTFDPNKFAKPLTKAEYAALEGKAKTSGSGEEAPAPLTDRAVNGTYPTGSTFKPITAMGTLEAGVINPSEGLGAGQCIHVSTEQFCNAGKADYGAVGLVEALKVSSDTYFFEAGELANSHGNVIQAEAHKLGVGEQTGIDLPSEITGLVPDRAWRAKVAHEELQCER